LKGSVSLSTSSKHNLTRCYCSLHAGQHRGTLGCWLWQCDGLVRRPKGLGAIEVKLETRVRVDHLFIYFLEKDPICSKQWHVMKDHRGSTLMRWRWYPSLEFNWFNFDQLTRACPNLMKFSFTSVWKFW
jgi:hypothetical protein